MTVVGKTLRVEVTRDGRGTFMAMREKFRPGVVVEFEGSEGRVKVRVLSREKLPDGRWKYRVVDALS